MKLLYSLSAIASISIAAAEIAPRLTSGAEFGGREFDYVVVGGGTAGLTIAARLSEDPETTVGVIEAGDYFPDDPLINTPSLGLAISGNATYDWLFKSVPQVNVNERAIDLPRGKMLGGSSGINAMVFDRGSKSEYDGTVALAPKEHGGVVDTKLKVYGTANVRVADASIMPLHIGSHTQRTVYGIGEKAAKIIKST
ncbi:Alcohol dehydrogenase [acceptor] OS=Pseudomonas putida GN=alkJ PE=3 SV=1 [Rhizoctonia solani AG-1 IB]|uniref:Alcohol dehydrogenase [acceptor] n=1 Tax=Thanatephorus cucumeris (strain AG1-IB / isolate 7/3/14) TaxID=1108050 RepID=A0A0B7FRA1_THACB|nr:Alcohol dehydrogenase [acceptor] OS=Pseudomonas putida GN=alkJ PE=3 SV=1 [Rhizoctonia solani AG-1 IB]